MVRESLLPLALAALASASVLPARDPGSFISFPITYKRNDAPVARRDIESTLYNISSISYLIELDIGTPAQPVKVAIDTGSDELWVDPDCQDDSLQSSQVKECVADGTYVADSSSTAKIFTNTTDIPYGKGEVLIQYVSDNIGLPGASANMTNVLFGVATKSSELNEGILGLGFGYKKNLKYPNFVDNLASQKVTQSKAFSVALGSVDASNGGVIIFGGVDTKKFSGSLVSNPILGPQGRETISRYWIQMTSVGLTKSGSSKTYSGGNTPIVLDSGSSLSFLPTSIVSAMASDLSGQLDKASGLYVVDCSQAASGSGNTFDFVFGGVTIKVPFHEFIWNLGQNQCVIGVEAVDSSSGITALLGDTFLRSAYVVFDQTTNTISMAQYVNCGQHEQSIPATGAGNFTGECQAAKPNAAGRTSSLSYAGLAVGLFAGVALGL